MLSTFLNPAMWGKLIEKSGDVLNLENKVRKTLNPSKVKNGSKKRVRRCKKKLRKCLKRLHSKKSINKRKHKKKSHKKKSPKKKPPQNMNTLF